MYICTSMLLSPLQLTTLQISNHLEANLQSRIANLKLKTFIVSIYFCPTFQQYNRQLSFAPTEWFFFNMMQFDQTSNFIRIWKILNPKYLNRLNIFIFRQGFLFCVVQWNCNSRYNKLSYPFRMSSVLNPRYWNVEIAFRNV